jgi:hypothetical protein
MYILKGLLGATLVLSMILVCSLNVFASEPRAADRTRTISDAESRQAGYVNAPNVRLREEGNLDARVIRNMSFGEELMIHGKAGDWYKVIHNGTNGYVFNEFVTFGEFTWGERNGDVEMLEWWGVGQAIMQTGTLATVTDIATGIQYQIRILFGTNHADAEPLTAEDTAKKWQANSGEWSWTPRAIWVTLNDGRTFAASANSVPHGTFSNNYNDFPGHFCIHFLNSTAHGSNRVNPRHQSQIHIAFNAAR